METLPLELRQEIISYISPNSRPRLDDVVIPKDPDSNTLSNLFAARLTCRTLNHAASNALKDTFERTTFFCTLRSLTRLEAIVENKMLGPRIEWLIIGGYDLHGSLSPLENRSTRKERLGKLIPELSKWTKSHAVDLLVKILRKLPRLRHIRCVPLVHNKWSDRAEAAKTLPDPEPYIQAAVRAAGLDHALESFAVYTKIGDLKPGEYQLLHPPRFFPGTSLQLSNLRHLTLSMQYLEQAELQRRNYTLPSCPNLEHVHLIYQKSVDRDIPREWKTVDDNSLESRIIRYLSSLEVKRVTVSSSWYAQGPSERYRYALREPFSDFDLYQVIRNFTSVYTATKPQRYKVRKHPLNKLILRGLNIRRFDTMIRENDDPIFDMDELHLYNCSWTRWKTLSDWEDKPLDSGDCVTGWDVLPLLCENAGTVIVHKAGPRGCDLDDFDLSLIK